MEQRLCLALALWNGRDAILKERMFGLTGNEGNRGEDVKEYWWYLDGVPSHSWNKWRYHYPPGAVPGRGPCACEQSARPAPARVRASRYRGLRRKSVLGSRPYELQTGELRSSVHYEPAEPTTSMFGGNSTWRGPVWFPLNYLVVTTLEQYHQFFGDRLEIEYPTRSGRKMPLDKIAKDLQQRLISHFPRWPWWPSALLRDRGSFPARQCLAGQPVVQPVFSRGQRRGSRSLAPDRLDRGRRGRHPPALPDISCARRGAPGRRAGHGARNAGQGNYKHNKELGRLTLAVTGAMGCRPRTEALCGSTIPSHRGPTARCSLSRWCGTWAWPR